MSDSISGKDSLQLDTRIFSDFADGQAIKVAFSNEKAKVKRGKNGNVIFGKDESGEQGELEVRVLIGSTDHKWLQSRMTEQDLDFSAFILLTGVFSKRVGDGKGNLSTIVYQCSGGVFSKNVDAMSSADGEPDQSVAMFKIVFGNVKPTIQ